MRLREQQNIASPLLAQAKKYARSLTTLLASICFVAVIMPAQTYADTTSITPNCSSNAIVNYLQQGVNVAVGGTGCGSSGSIGSEIGTLASEVVNIFSIIVGVVAVIMIIYGGFRYITSGGDNSRVGGAKNTLIYAIIGLVIVALAQLIVHYVLNTAANITSGV